jgi:hypothetical protein
MNICRPMTTTVNRVIRRSVMTQLNKISAADAKQAINDGMALLVCVYDDDKFRDTAHLEGGIPISEFLRMKPDLALDTRIIFY